MPAPLMQIGEVAERVGLSLRTVRYYEEMGLVSPEARTEGGFRLYSADQLERLELIKRMKPLGFTVQEMRALLEARRVARDAAASPAAAEDARQALAAFAQQATERCQTLQRRLADAEAFAAEVRRESRRSGGAPAPSSGT